SSPTPFPYTTLFRSIDAVRAAKPDVLFVAMGAPRQERFVLEHGAELGAKAILAIGGSLDMLAGRVRRAPPWVQRSGLEWLWRLRSEEHTSELQSREN